MYYPFFRRKLVIAVLAFFMLMSSAAIDNQASSVYAKKDRQEKVTVKKSSQEDVSKKDLLDLVASLKETITKLDSRIASIENRLDVIAEKQDNNRKSEIESKWLAFSKNKNEEQSENVAMQNKQLLQNQTVESSNNIEKDNQKIVIEPDEKKLASSKLEKAEELKTIEDNNSKKNNKDDENIKLASIELGTIGEKENRVFLNKHPDGDYTLEHLTGVSKNNEHKTEFVDKNKEANKITQQKTKDDTDKIKEDIKKFKYNIYVQKEQENNYEVGSVFIGNKKVIAYRSEAAGIDPYARAQIVASRLEALLNRGVDLKSLQPALRNGQFIGSVNSEVLFTVDPLTANRSGIKMQNLTLSWVNNVRSALGAPVVQRIAGLSASRGLSGGGREVQESYNNPYGRNFDRTHQANVQRSNNSEIINKLFPVIPEGMGRTLMGQASWYGPYFHGRRSADGSRYNMYEMTAAHKSLPFGTIVKVTNVNNKKECIVKITDRGPYIHGRIIDLSKAAAQQIGMLGSGVANVKVEVIGKIPRHIRRR